MQPKPTLSAVICNFNHSRYIPDALNAVLKQSYRPDEVIVVDDASTDDSVEVISAFARCDSRIRVVEHERNIGPISSANDGLDSATGDYVYVGAADDHILPEFFERSMDLLDRHPQAGLCCTDPAYFDERTREMRAGRLKLRDRPGYLSAEEFVGRARKRCIGIPGHTTVIKRAALQRAGAFLPELRWHCDWFLVLVIAFREGVCCVPEPLAAMMVRADSYSASGMKEKSSQREVLRMILRTLISSRYADVAPAFRRTGVLANLGAGILPVLLERTEFSDFLNAALARWLLVSSARNLAVRLTPARIKALYQLFRDRPKARELPL